MDTSKSIEVGTMLDNAITFKEATSPYGVFNQDIWCLILDSMVPPKSITDGGVPIPIHFNNMIAINTSIGWITARKISVAGLTIWMRGHEFAEYINTIRQFNQPGLLGCMSSLKLGFISHDDSKLGIQALQAINLPNIEHLNIEFVPMFHQQVTQRVIYREPIKIPKDQLQLSASDWAPRNVRLAARAILAGKPLQRRKRILQEYTTKVFVHEDVEGWEEIESGLRSLKAQTCVISGLKDEHRARAIARQIEVNWFVFKLQEIKRQYSIIHELDRRFFIPA